ncbi:aminoacyl-tRNA hydrolase [Synechococcus sp. PCC 7502]|uniref:aminoacyl-tRNA hydrolase n=1 Tax=Synechococcus sp. PCC 7502 TaxID=1173263 RepID=UPI001FED423D|nr:aminoacyl-tRNA hydrolase [Synechococcus sp. PCC 7502]
MMSDQISLIVGLGNPGQEYDHTRHNVGYLLVDYLANLWSISLIPDRKFKGIYGEKKPIRLLKPTTYMNLSGQSLRLCCNWYKLDPHSVLVIYDDMDLPLGKLRIRTSGSAGGHNGIKSIIQELGTQDFPRLRIGIGSAEIGGAVSHVLGKFTIAEMQQLTEIFKTTEQAIAVIRDSGIPKAMSLYNGITVGTT